MRTVPSPTTANHSSKSLNFGNAEFAIITARWNYYLGLPQSDPFNRSAVLMKAGAASPDSDFDSALAEGLAATINTAQRAGVRRVLLIAPLPEFPWYAPYCVMRSIRSNLTTCSIPRQQVESLRQATMVVLRDIALHNQNVRLVDPLDVFCDRTQCRPNAGTLMYFSDTSHISVAGAKRPFQRFDNDFRWIFTGRDDPRR